MNTTRKHRLINIDRNQNVFRAIDIESLVDDDHQVRAIWDFVGRLDLSQFYSEIGSYEGDAGRPSWDPRLLVAIWVYAYSRGISSAREIERRCSHDPAFQWLMGMEIINHHTLSDFRMQKSAKLEEMFTQTLALLTSDGLITLERVMQDGTKIKANASDGTFRREQRLKEYLRLAKEQVAAMGDPNVECDSEKKKRAKERAARERQEKLELALKELEKLRESKKDKSSKEGARVSTSDPEARVMKQGGGGFAPSYNAQICTDSANGIIVDARLSQSGVDVCELIPSIESIEKTFGKSPKQGVVDKGYAQNQNTLDLDEKKIDLICPIPDKKDNGVARYRVHGISSEFRAEHFDYHSEADNFTCPAGKHLGRNGSENMSGQVRNQYIARTKDCNACHFKPKCCPNAKRGRVISRVIENVVITNFKAKMDTEEAKLIYKTRSAVAEFSNAWLKAKIGLRQFCLRGLKKAELELKWACMTMNIQYWARLKWTH